MKEKFVNSSINFVSKYKTYNELDLIKLKYGFEGLYSLILKTTITILASIILNVFQETLLLMLFYLGLRTFSYGLHAKSNIACWITTLTIYIGIPILSKFITIPIIISYSILIISLISMILWAPADTPKKPLIRKIQRQKCKIFAIIVAIAYIIIFTINKINVINNMIIYASLIQIIFINPLTYKLTNTRFNNYKYYHKK